LDLEAAGFCESGNLGMAVCSKFPDEGQIHLLPDESESGKAEANRFRVLGAQSFQGYLPESTRKRRVRVHFLEDMFTLKVHEARLGQVPSHALEEEVAHNDQVVIRHGVAQPIQPEA
jgi:hypothetical protein